MKKSENIKKEKQISRVCFPLCYITSQFHNTKPLWYRTDQLLQVKGSEEKSLVLLFKMGFQSFKRLWQTGSCFIPWMFKKYIYN